LDRPDPREEHVHLIAKIEALPINSLGLRLSDATWTGWSIRGDNGFADLGEASRVTVKRLLNSAIEPLMASWYTGILRISEGELLRYEHLGFGSEYERDQLIEIVAGSAARRWTVDNRPGYEARSREIRTKPSGWP